MLGLDEPRYHHNGIILSAVDLGHSQALSQRSELCEEGVI